MTNYSLYRTALKSHGGPRTSIVTDHAVSTTPARAASVATAPDVSCSPLLMQDEIPLWVRLLAACSWLDCLNPFLVMPLYAATHQYDGSSSQA
jgi:hypothetical protein